MVDLWPEAWWKFRKTTLAAFFVENLNGIRFHSLLFLLWTVTFHCRNMLCKYHEKKHIYICIYIFVNIYVYVYVYIYISWNQWLPIRTVKAPAGEYHGGRAIPCPVQTFANSGRVGLLDNKSTILCFFMFACPWKNMDRNKFIIDLFPIISDYFPNAFITRLLIMNLNGNTWYCIYVPF